MIFLYVISNNYKNRSNDIQFAIRTKDLKYNRNLHINNIQNFLREE